jgi:hypothetical protein
VLRIAEFTLPHEGHVVVKLSCGDATGVVDGRRMVESGSHPICGLLEAAAAGRPGGGANCALDIAAAGQLWLYADGALGICVLGQAGTGVAGQVANRSTVAHLKEKYNPAPTAAMYAKKPSSGLARSFEPLMEDASSTHRPILTPKEILML